MRVVLHFAFTLAWISACFGCGTSKPPAMPTSRELATTLESETVALVRLADKDGNDDEHGAPRAYCAGVFVSPTVVLTAGHCVDFLGMDPERAALHHTQDDGDLPRWNAIGQTARFALQTSGLRYWTGTVIADDYDVDLGAVRVDPLTPLHPFARVRLGDIHDGDRVEVVGHPVGFTWSYAEGIVSGTRDDDRNPWEHKALSLQIAAPISVGNSGGGVFDRLGNLLGIVSFGSARLNGMGFCVHRDSVRAFLARLPL